MIATASRTRTGAFFWFMALYTAWHVVWLGLLTFDFVTHPLAPDQQFGSIAFRLVLGTIMLPLGLVVSALVIRRSPGNVTGLCLLLWLTLVMGQLLRPNSPLITYASAINTGWTGLWLLGTFFPNGRAAIPRFDRPIQLLSALGVLTIAFWAPFHVGLGGRPNPFYIAALSPLSPIVDALEMIFLMPIVLLIAPSLIVRYRLGDRRTRLQLKWLAWVYGVLFLMIIPLALGGLLGQGETAALLAERGPWARVALMVFVVYSALAPFLAVGNAILRHRLYDVEVLIRRTAVYATVSVLLGLLFYGSVIVLQRLFTDISGQQSPVAIVASTLAIAALFSPVRSRVQDLVDRRFYRRKYDAQQVLASFAAVARDETNLDRLTGQLAAAVEETMRPDGITIWLEGNE